MSTRKVVFGLVICLFLALFIGQSFSQAQGPNYQLEPIDHERLRNMNQEQRDRYFEQRAKQREIERQRLRRMTPEQKDRYFERRAAREKELREQQWAKQKLDFEQRIKDRHEGKDARRNRNIKKMLEVTEEQWKVIEPQIDKIYFLRKQSSIGMQFGWSLGDPNSNKGVITEHIQEYDSRSSSGSSGGYSVSRRDGRGGGSVSYRSGGGGGSYGYGSSGGSSGGGSYGYRSGGGSSGGGRVGYGSGGGSSGGGGSAGGRGLALTGPPWRLLDRESTEVEKLCEELFELMENENSSKEEIVQKMEALQQARESAKRQLAEAEQELRKLLTYRQDANLVLRGVIN